MGRRSGGRSPKVIPLNAEETLYETGTREVWQSIVTTAAGEEIGPVIRQVVEPGMYTIRYFVVFDLKRDRHILLPSNAVTDITESRVLVDVTRADVEKMPEFQHTMTRGLEEAVYDSLGQTPHWVEETLSGATERDDEY